MDKRQWRAARKIVTATPSGLDVTLRRVAIADLLANGKIPQTLDTLTKRATADGFSVSEAAEFMPLIDEVVRAAVIEPPIGETADDEHITLGELPFEDRMAIFQWANGDATALQPFRAEQNGDVESAHAGDDVSHAA
jgi:hypothetical protein